ncbi:MAG TPA: dihydrofolate reductase [Tenuifilaceae bacterium]|jgi:dihydrofolate reductase|nr:dihydrofolate reductase [Tenuifilaceae bacterium]HOY72599.1 dihydrofolate reductase [Tenuifilaceae bacterium]HPG99408.1 dihydrofolate reductase [Tenuifilaceae bacterium]HPW26405.1 dihydrofolate reductase [Tenuifilaceae bacterium]HQM04304.1 dihydrofolate reductase [Tenuifilaceae bacterium]
MVISIVVATSENRVIGKNNQLLWHISEDLKRFKKLTTGHTVIMGRKTFESIGQPLPNRHNIVISRSEGLKFEGCTAAKSLADALEIASTDEEVFIIGGGEVYRQALPLAERIYLTLVHANYEGDTFFPALNPNEWKVVREEKVSPTEGPGISFLDYVRQHS